MAVAAEVAGAVAETRTASGPSFCPECARSGVSAVVEKLVEQRSIRHHALPQVVVAWPFVLLPRTSCPMR
jgi:hypothetical protein